MTPNARAQKYQSEVEKRGHGIDLKYPGSTFTQRLKSYSKDGRYLILVVGLFANFSEDFMVLCDFLGRVRALRTLSSWNINPKHALAMNHHILVSHFGHVAALAWARLILSAVFVELCCLIFNPLLAQALSSTPFLLTLVVGDTAVDMSQGLRRAVFALPCCLSYKEYPRLKKKIN